MERVSVPQLQFGAGSQGDFFCSASGEELSLLHLRASLPASPRSSSVPPRCPSRTSPLGPLRHPLPEFQIVSGGSPAYFILIPTYSFILYETLSILQTNFVRIIFSDNRCSKIFKSLNLHTVLEMIFYINCGHIAGIFLIIQYNLDPTCEIHSL